MDRVGVTIYCVQETVTSQASGEHSPSIPTTIRASLTAPYEAMNESVAADAFCQQQEAQDCSPSSQKSDLFCSF